jgi:hypothetical protein
MMNPDDAEGQGCATTEQERKGLSKGKVANLVMKKKTRDTLNRRERSKGREYEERVKEMHGTEIWRSKVEVEKEPPRREIKNEKTRKRDEPRSEHWPVGWWRW